MTRLARAPLLLHCAALLVALVALAPFMQLDSSFTSDEGAYAIQARAVAEGRWDYEHRLAEFDADGSRFPVVNSLRVGERWYPYVQHPLVPLLLSVAWRLPGRAVGLHVLPLAAVVACAAAAWLLAARLARRAAPLAFWLAAGAPVLANGWMLWAHAPSAAVSGFALLAVLATVRRPTWSLAIAGGGALALGVLLRSEGLIFAGACAGAVLAMRWRERRTPVVILAALAPAVVGLGAKVAERAWTAAITGGTPEEPARATGDFLAGRLQGAWHEVAQGRYGEGSAWLAPVALALAITAGLLLGRRDDRSARRAASALLAVAAALVLARAVTTPDDPVTGLLAAWPVAAVGLAALRRDRLVPDAVAMLTVVVLFGGAVLATQYPVGGGLEWGGRFLSPLTAPLAALAAFALADRFVPTVAVLAVAGAAAAMIVVGTLRWEHDRAINDVEAHLRPNVVTTQSALPRLAWRVDGDVGWLLVDQREAGPLAREIAERNDDVLLAAGRRDRVDPLDGLRAVPTGELESDLLRLWTAP